MRFNTVKALAFGAAVVAGTSAHGQVRQQTRDGAFQWTGDLAPGARLYIHNLNGPLSIETTSGRRVEISAREVWRRGDPADVSFEARRTNGDRDVLICAIWKLQYESCDERGLQQLPRNRRRNTNDNDVRVEFTVKLPAGAHVTAHTVNGDVEITGASGDVDAETVNGNVDAESSNGEVAANTVNGDIHVRTGRVPRNGTRYETVNGSVSVSLPANTDADIVASTVTGSVTSDFPITVSGSMSPRRIRGVIGRGGPRIEISTVNGRVRISKQ